MFAGFEAFSTILVSILLLKGENGLLSISPSLPYAALLNSNTSLLKLSHAISPWKPLTLFVTFSATVNSSPGLTVEVEGTAVTVTPSSAACTTEERLRAGMLLKLPAIIAIAKVLATAFLIFLDTS